jgi:hypothetical protein
MQNCGALLSSVFRSATAPGSTVCDINRLDKRETQMVKKVFLVVFVLFCLGAIFGAGLIYYSANKFSGAIEAGLNQTGGNDANGHGRP